MFILKHIFPPSNATIPIYLIIFYVYFDSYGTHSPTFTLLIGWIVLLIVRSAHYANRKLGNIIGGFIGAFFLPFGFITFVLNVNTFFENPPPDLIPIVILLFYFFLILLVQVPLEILMDYLASQDKERELRSKWENDLSFVKRK